MTINAVQENDPAGSAFEDCYALTAIRVWDNFQMMRFGSTKLVNIYLVSRSARKSHTSIQERRSLRILKGELVRTAESTKSIRNSIKDNTDAGHVENITYMVCHRDT